MRGDRDNDAFDPRLAGAVAAVVGDTDEDNLPWEKSEPTPRSKRNLARVLSGIRRLPELDCPECDNQPHGEDDDTMPCGSCAGRGCRDCYGTGLCWHCSPLPEAWWVQAQAEYEECG